MKQILETPRLLLRELTPDDYPALAAILQDAKTMYAYEGAFSDEETADWLRRQITRYETDGFGLWAVIAKETGTMIGQAGITYQQVETTNVLEIGYLFNRAHWHKGYAIEAAKACKHYAFQTLRAQTVYSIVRDTNLASLNVAIRNGMLVRKRFLKHYRGIDMPHYALCVHKKEEALL